MEHTYICNLEGAQGVLTYKSAAMNWSGLHDRKIRTERTLLFSVRSVRILFVMLYDTLHTSLICMRFLGFSKTTYLHVLPGLLKDHISSCASWAIHRPHIFMCSRASHLFDLLRKHEAETDEQQDTGPPDHRHAIMYGEISTNSGTNSKEENHTKIMSHLLQLLLFMIPQESG